MVGCEDFRFASLCERMATLTDEVSLTIRNLYRLSDEEKQTQRERFWADYDGLLAREKELYAQLLEASSEVAEAERNVRCGVKMMDNVLIRAYYSTLTQAMMRRSDLMASREVELRARLAFLRDATAPLEDNERLALLCELKQHCSLPFDTAEAEWPD